MSIDYDELAPSYERRYASRDFGELASALAGIVERGERLLEEQAIADAEAHAKRCGSVRSSTFSPPRAARRAERRVA